MAKWNGYSACDLIRWCASKSMSREAIKQTLGSLGLIVSEATIGVQASAWKRGKAAPSLSEALAAQLQGGTRADDPEDAPEGPRRFIAPVRQRHSLLVITGGQTGVPTGILHAAQACGLRTGGLMPRGFKRNEGDGKEIASRFGLTEYPSPNYTDRTAKNLERSEALVRIAFAKAEFGTEIPDWTDVVNSKKPNFDVYAFRAGDAVKLAKWLRQFRTVFFAGNSEQIEPGGFQWAKAYFTDVFELMRRSKLEPERKRIK